MTDNRIHETDLLVPVLRLLDDSPTDSLTMTDLISMLEERFHPEGADAQMLENRNDTRFSQIVRNIVSHKTTGPNPIARGFVEHLSDQSALRITPEGRKFLVFVTTGRDS